MLQGLQCLLGLKPYVFAIQVYSVAAWSCISCVYMLMQCTHLAMVMNILDVLVLLTAAGNLAATTAIVRSSHTRSVILDL